MEDTILLMADLKRHKGSLSGVFILVLLVCTALGTVLSIWMNSERYLREEMERAGFGTLTAWVSNVPDMDALADNIADLEAVGNVDTQVVIYSDYTVNDQDSDSEGQLIPHGTEDRRYKFFEDELSGYRGDIPEIRPGEIYVSPSMISMFGVQIGDEIRFQVARGGQAADFTVKGFYEDPFMGSSMIGMKGFLISEADYSGIIQTIRDTGIDALARDGAMLHIFQADTNGEGVTVSQLNQLINENTELPQYLEFLHSGNAIAGFMLILQNAFSGFLAAFVVVLIFVVLIVLGHGIGSSIEADYVNMGILKTIGFTGGKLRRIQLAQYMLVILTGMVLGILAAVYVSRIVSAATLTTTGIRIPTDLPAAWCFLISGLLFLVLTGFIVFKTGKLKRITPMKAIGGEAFIYGTRVKKGFPIRGNYLKYSMALRQLTAGARRYSGACIVAILLVFFASMIGRMATWLGADGKGMMDAFNPAAHDIGV